MKTAQQLYGIPNRSPVNDHSRGGHQNSDQRIKRHRSWQRQSLANHLLALTPGEAGEVRNIQRDGGPETTVTFRAGTRNLRKSEKLAKRDGAASMGPNPPAARYAQAKSRSPTASRTGALIPWSTRIYSTPLRMTARLISQKTKKQIAVL